MEGADERELVVATGEVVDGAAGVGEFTEVAANAEENFEAATEVTNDPIAAKMTEGDPEAAPSPVASAKDAINAGVSPSTLEAAATAAFGSNTIAGKSANSLHGPAATSRRPVVPPEVKTSLSLRPKRLMKRPPLLAGKRPVMTLDTSARPVLSARAAINGAAIQDIVRPRDIAGTRSGATKMATDSTVVSKTETPAQAANAGGAASRNISDVSAGEAKLFAGTAPSGNISSTSSTVVSNGTSKNSSNRMVIDMVAPTKRPAAKQRRTKSTKDAATEGVVATGANISTRPASKSARGRSTDMVKRPVAANAKAKAQKLAPGPMAETMRENAKLAPKTRPLDSIKNRFRPAPKGFATTDARKAAEGRPYQAEDFLNPSHSARQYPAEPAKETLHLYGMMDGPEAPTIGAWTHNTSEDGLGIIEDYHPTRGHGENFATLAMPGVGTTGGTEAGGAGNAGAGDAGKMGMGAAGNGGTRAVFSARNSVTPVIQVADSSPSKDTNRYILGARSPYFLNSINVDKRPLSNEQKATRALGTGDTAGTGNAVATNDVTNSVSVAVNNMADNTVVGAGASKADIAIGAANSNEAQVAKKPLVEIEAPVYAAQQLTAVGQKNSYEKAKPQGHSDPASAPSPQHTKNVKKSSSPSPTVIIPARRRSHAPLFLLLLVTVVLGAVVGALAYLCFFQ